MSVLQLPCHTTRNLLLLQPKKSSLYLKFESVTQTMLPGFLQNKNDNYRLLKASKPESSTGTSSSSKPFSTQRLGVLFEFSMGRQYVQTNRESMHTCLFFVTMCCFSRCHVSELNLCSEFFRLVTFFRRQRRSQLQQACSGSSFSNFSKFVINPSTAFNF